ncbi:hypothetical protein [Trichormus sp. NMC-1]|uniref:hypothetical protein n=1 Tax=Trichormus sp. NMC-1 TaxID=1853259 RepID=UPI0008DC2694|nr:hypothetical protein [Trichormus sp. NMC-1]
MSVLDFLTSLSNSTPEPMVGLVLATLFILFLLLVAIAFLIFLIFLQRIPGTGFLFVDLDEMITRWLTPKPSPSRRGRESRSDLQVRLLQLLNNDVATARRLINQQRQLHPEKSDRWILEKVIWDLERDRN